MANSLGYFGSYGDEEGTGESQTQATQNFFQNEYDPKADYGRCTIDVAQYFVAYGVYDLPFGRGKLIGSNVSRPVNAVIGGWKIAGDIPSTPASASLLSPVPTWVTRIPMTRHPTLTGSYQPRPDCVAKACRAMNPCKPCRSAEALAEPISTLKAVTEVADVADGGTFGNCQNGALRGPGLKTADLNITKTVYFTDTFNAGVLCTVHQPDQHADLQRAGQLVGSVQLVRSLQRRSHHRPTRRRRRYDRTLRPRRWIEPWTTS